MKEIIIYGSNCKGCETFYNNILKVINKLNIKANISKKDNLEEAFKKGITKLPGLVIDNQVISYGMVLDEEMLEEMFEEIGN